ncbi:MAG: flavodoxin [Oliverpabstia sp.]
MRKKVKLFVTTMIATVAFSMTAFAAGWVNGQGANSGRWWYDLGDGTYYAGSESIPSWQWLDGNQDGVAECYAFDMEGWMYADTTTPDGYQVNSDGAWIENGTVQTRNTLETTNTEGQETAGGDDILIAYFSRTNTTERAANLIQQQVGGTLFEIHPAEPYPASYTATTERAQREISAGSLPALAGNLENFEDYEIIFIGYPIWWDTTPPVVNTFLNSHDFSGKTVIPFCTSGGSGISGSLSSINRYCKGGTILRGKDVTGDSIDTVRSWLSGIGMLP